MFRHHLLHNFVIFSSLQKEILYSSAFSCHSFLSSSSDNHDECLSVSMHKVYILGISCKWNHVICDSLWLISLVQPDVFNVCPACSINSYFISFENPILHLLICLIYPFISCWIFRVFSLFFPIIQNAIMNIHIQVFTFISLGFVPISGIVESHGNLCLRCLKNFQFSKVAVPFYTSTSHVCRFQFSDIVNNEPFILHF